MSEPREDVEASEYGLHSDELGGTHDFVLASDYRALKARLEQTERALQNQYDVSCEAIRRGEALEREREKYRGAMNAQLKLREAAERERDSWRETAKNEAEQFEAAERALREIADEVHGREKIPNVYDHARAALASGEGEER